MLKFVAAVVVAAVLCASTTLISAAKPTPEDFLVKSLPNIPLMSKNYAGSLNISEDGKTTAFFWFVESESNPKNSPVVSFFSGGPGCSSLIFLSTEGGPVQMRHGGEFVVNPWRWTQHSNLLVIESPGGVGFSQAPADTQWDDATTSVYNRKALEAFFGIFTEFAELPYYITGESYGGRYVPTVANEILMHSPKIRKNVRGVAVGNPCIGTIGCNQPDPTLKSLLQANGYIPYAEKGVESGNARYDPYDLLVPTCDNDGLYDYVKFMDPVNPVVKAYGDRLRREGRHPAQRRSRGSLRNPPAPYGPCSMDYITSYFNREDVKEFIHAPKGVSWYPCSPSLHYNIPNVSMMPLFERFSRETDWNLMVYSGLSDSVVNHQQSELIIKSESNFKLKKQEYVPWYRPDVWNSTETQHGGFYLEYEGRFSFCGVKDAGHMVPQYNPPSGYEVLRSFIALGRCGRLQN